MLNKYPTDTAFGNKDVTKIITDIKETLVQDYDIVNIPCQYGRIVGVETQIRDFTQPVVFRYNSELYAGFNHKQSFGDGRKRDTILNAIKSYLILQFGIEGGRKYRSDYQFTGVVFTKLVSNNLVRTYNLNAEQGTIIQMILADYYNYLLLAGDDGKPLSEDDRITGILKFSSAGGNVAEEIAKQQFIYEGIKSVATVINEANISPKLKRLTPASLLTVVSGIIYGQSAKEDISIAMEYPPIWAWLVYRSLSNVSYKNTLLTKTALTISKGGKHNVLEYSKLMDDIDKNFSR